MSFLCLQYEPLCIRKKLKTYSVSQCKLQKKSSKIHKRSMKSKQCSSQLVRLQVPVPVAVSKIVTNMAAVVKFVVAYKIVSLGLHYCFVIQCKQYRCSTVACYQKHYSIHSNSLYCRNTVTQLAFLWSERILSFFRRQ